MAEDDEPGGEHRLRASDPLRESADRHRPVPLGDLGLYWRGRRDVVPLAGASAIGWLPSLAARRIVGPGVPRELVTAELTRGRGLDLLRDGHRRRHAVLPRAPGRRTAGSAV